MATSKELEAKVAELERQLAEAKKEADAQRAQERAIVIKQVNELIANNDIRAEELTFPRSLKGGKASAPKSSNGTAGKPRYRDPETGSTWTGHGKAPGWIPKDKEERKRFLIQP